MERGQGRRKVGCRIAKEGKQIKVRGETKRGKNAAKMTIMIRGKQRKTKHSKNVAYEEWKVHHDQSFPKLDKCKWKTQEKSSFEAKGTSQAKSRRIEMGENARD